MTKNGRMLLEHMKEYYKTYVLFFDYGFISYKIDYKDAKSYITLVDVFIEKQHRSKGEALKMIKHFKTYWDFMECVFITSVNKSNPLKRHSMSLCDSMGMRLVIEDEEKYYYELEVRNE